MACERRTSVVLLRQEIGDVLRDARRQQGRTLREVSSVARVSLGYLSEVERGQKEASSELLASICGALEVPLSSVLREVSQRVAATEHGVDDVRVPDTVPDDLADQLVPPTLTEPGAVTDAIGLQRAGLVSAA
jgi:transcriptional regulator with XRE-family HTH domain